VREAEAFAYGSFSFATHDALLGAMSAIARAELASESFAFDPFLQAQRMKRDSLVKDARQLGNMLKAEAKAGGIFKAMKEGAKVALAGRSFLDGVPFSLHCIAEGRHQSGVDADMRAIEAIVREHGGAVVENSIPKILRANPFPPPNSMLGPGGERWVPVHGFLPHSRLVEAWERLQALWDANAAEMARLKVETGALIAATGRSACLIEPVFYWPGEQNPLHAHAIEADHLATAAPCRQPRSDRAGRDAQGRGHRHFPEPWRDPPADRPNLSTARAPRCRWLGDPDGAQTAGRSQGSDEPRRAGARCR